MKHDHSAFSYPDRAQARVAYGSTPAELIRKFMPMVKRLARHAYGSGRPGMEVPLADFEAGGAPLWRLQ